MKSRSFPASESPERIHALDSLRGFAMLLGVLLHGAMPFMTFDVPWVVRNEERHLVFDALVGGIHPFRMQLFFLIAGFFAHLLYGRLGARGFAWHRTKRILVPFLAGMLLIAPLVHGLWNARLSRLAPIHLWFLEYLLIYYAGVLVFVPLSRRLVGGSSVSRLDDGFAKLVRAPWKPLVLALPIAAVTWFSTMWADADGGAGISLLPRWPGLTYYALFFVFGWFLHRQPQLLVELAHHVWRYFGWAALAFPLMGGLLLFESQKAHPYYSGLKLACLLAGGTYTWLMIFALVGFFVRYLNRPNAAIRYVADSSYWLYLTHLPLVVFLQIQFVKSDWGAFVKFAAINAITLAALYLSYELLVRYTFIGATLNGPRARWQTTGRHELYDKTGKDPFHSVPD